MAENVFNPLSFWGYKEERDFNPISYGSNITVSPEDKVINIENDVISATITLDYENGDLSLVGKDGSAISTVNLPKSDMLKSVSYDSDTNELVLVFETNEGENEIRVNMSSLVDTYEAGDGLQLAGNVLSIKINADSSDILTATAEGLSVNLNKYATNETVATMNENVAQSIQTLNDNLVAAINTINGGLDNEIRPAISANTEAVNQAQTDIIALTGQVDSEVARATAAETVLRGAIDNEVSRAQVAETNLNQTIATVNENVAQSIQTLNDNMVQAINTINGGLDNEIRPAISANTDALATKVGFTDVADDNLPNRKAIILPSVGDVILGTTEEGSISLIQYNRWGIVDLGSATKPINLNTPAGVRPTVQEAGQTGDEANEIAYVSDIPTALPNPNALTIKYNGQTAFTYDGSAAETGNFTVTADTVPGVGGSDTVAANIQALQTALSQLEERVAALE